MSLIMLRPQRQGQLAAQDHTHWRSSASGLGRCLQQCGPFAVHQRLTAGQDVACRSCQFGDRQVRLPPALWIGPGVTMIAPELTPPGEVQIDVVERPRR